MLQFGRPGASTMSLPLATMFEPPQELETATPQLAGQVDNLPTPRPGYLAGAEPARSSPRARASTVSGVQPPPVAMEMAKQANKTPATPMGTSRARKEGTQSPANGPADSIFRLLPRETRPALRRMLHVEPSARCTLTDLLKGRGKASGLLCGCRGPAAVVAAHPGERCEDHDFDSADEDDGDAWLRSITPCSLEGMTPDHVHIKLAADVAKPKRRFFK